MSVQEKIRTLFYSIIDLIDASTDEELNFKSDRDSWSMLECVEHICLVNGNVSRLLLLPPPPTHENTKSELYSEDKLHHLLVTKREVKRNAPEIVNPKGIFKTAAEAKKVIYEDTENILHALENTAVLKETHTIPHHALGEMTKTDWLHFMIAHTQRHLLQLEEIKRRSAAKS